MFRSPLRSACAGLCVLLLAALSGPLYAQPITPAAEAQIAALLADKDSRNSAEQKVDSTLLYASRIAAGRPMAAGFSTPTAQIRAFVAQAVAADRTVAVTVRGNVTAGLLGAIAAAGGIDVRSYPQFARVTARVPIGAVVALAQDNDVQFIAPTARAMTQKMVFDKAQVTAESVANASAEPSGIPVANVGAATSAGVTREGADLAQATGIAGAGTKICVISDSAYNASITAARSTNDLPATVQILENPPAGVGENEGTAMLEIVYDMAPGASLAFATAFISDVDFASNIVKLRASPYNCDIIADDVSYDNEGAFQDGIIAQAVNTVVASGAMYFSAAANSGNVLSGTSGTWEGDFVNGGASSSALTGTGNLHSFGATNYDVLTSAGSEVTLQWSDPLGGSGNDYDLFALNANGTSVVGSSTNVQNGSQDPFEFIYPSPPAGSRIVVVQRPSAAARALRIDTLRGTLQVGTVGSTYGHNAAAAAYTVASVDARSHTGQFTSSDLIDFYSSDGPRKIFYQPNGTAITPGNFLFGSNGGTTLSKVDVTAADCVATTLPSPFNPFCGTSAATPHAAAIAGLVRSAMPGITPAQVRTALTTTALDIEGAGFDVTSGYGIVMAPAAVRSVLAPLTAGKSYLPNSVAASTAAALTITLANSNGVALRGIAFTDSYASGVVNASSVATVSGTGCTGTLQAVAAASTLTLTNGVVPAGQTCTYTANVKSSTAGSYVDGSGTATTPIALNTGLGTATLTVGGGGGGGVAPTITSAATAKFTVRTKTTFTVKATGTPAPTIAITSGTLPAGLKFTNNGNGTATISGATTAAVGTYKIQITASNGNPPAAVQMLTLTVKRRLGF